jgi:hypothetical protein
MLDSLAEGQEDEVERSEDSVSVLCFSAETMMARFQRATPISLEGYMRGTKPPQRPLIVNCLVHFDQGAQDRTAYLPSLPEIVGCNSSVTSNIVAGLSKGTDFDGAPLANASPFMSIILNVPSV